MNKHTKTMNHPVDGTDGGLADSPGPLYQKIKNRILQNITDGTYGLNEKLPSEQEFVERFGVARMTVHRALRELTTEGLLVRLPGVGTFVAEPKSTGSALELTDIREEIIGRGNQHDCNVVRQEAVRAPADVRDALQLPANSNVFHGLILHLENSVPVQLEERFIAPPYGEGFLDEDLSSHTLYEFLRARSAPTEVEHVIEAARPKRRTIKLLELDEGEPVLVIRRRTWVGADVAVFTRFTYPGDRYYVVDRHKIDTITPKHRRR